MAEPEPDTLWALLRRLEVKLDTLLGTAPEPPAERVLTQREVTTTLSQVTQRLVRLEVNVEFLLRDYNTMRRELDELRRKVL
jgi:hypothetical protein